MLPEMVASYEYLWKSKPMNITLLTNRDLASHLALSRLVSQLSDHKLSIFISEKVGKDQNFPASLLALAKFEQDIIASSDHSFDDLAAQAGCYLQGFTDIGNRVNSAEGLARIKATEPELIVSIRFGLIIDDQVINTPKYGVINLHSGLLPEYRGVMATFRAMLDQQAEIGSTLHFIQNSGIDNGDIISIAKRPLNLQQSYLLNTLHLYSAGCQQIVSAVTTLQEGKALSARAQLGEAGYYSFPDAPLLKSFADQGYQLFDNGELGIIKQLQR